MADIYHRALRGDDVAATALNVMLNNTPFINLFYSRLLLNYLFIWDLQESLNPGYLRRAERRMEREHGQHFLIQP